jgi:hypothetical protein
MDVFKLAFETTIVGLLTFVWLGVATYLLFPDFKLDSIKERLPALVKDNPTAIGIGALILAYCLGSAILPIANQLVNDEHWPLNESGIRCQVFTEQGHWLKNVGVDELPKGKDFSLAELEPGHCSYWAPIFTARPIGIRARIWRFLRLLVGSSVASSREGVKSEEALLKIVDALERGRADKNRAALCQVQDSAVLAEVCGYFEAGKDKEALGVICGDAGGEIDKTVAAKCDEFKAGKILTIFQEQEITVLNQGADKTERLRQLHERIVVLRGAVFSGFVLLLICLFAFFARMNGSNSNWLRPACGILIAVLFSVFGFFNGYRDLVNQDIFDTPVLEILLVVITLFGGVLAFRRANTPRFLTKRYVLVALFFTGLTYGGWMWSEILYDQQVIDAFAILQNGAETPQEAPRP